MKVVGASQECVIAFGASFSTLADSHIVCIQNEDGTYTSRTMNIRDQQRTGRLLFEILVVWFVYLFRDTTSIQVVNNASVRG